MESTMRKMLLAVAAAVLIAAPAVAQAAERGAGNRYAVHRSHVSAGARAPLSGAAYGASARSPVLVPGSGYRWPGALYDADGRYIDQNAPGRW